MAETFRSLEDVAPPRMGLVSLFLRFLSFGIRAFGGPVAQIAMIRRELVEREQWISSARFNRLLAVMQALPGPEAHELCVHLGMRARGRIGGLLAGLGFMLPGLVLMLALGWFYFLIDWGEPRLASALPGVQAGVVGLVLCAVPRIGRHVMTSRWLIALGVGAAFASLLGVNFWIILIAAGAAHGLVGLGRPRAALVVIALAAIFGAVFVRMSDDSLGQVSQGLAASGPGQADLLLLFASGLKAGLLTFGGAYTAIPLVRQDAIGRGWMSDGQFLDGLALSGVLPAPLIIFTTFVGYVAGGFSGALAMTVGVFLPAFAFSMIFYDRLEAVVDDRRLRALLDGVAAGAVGLIAATAAQLAFGLYQGRETGWPLLAVALIAAVAAWRWRSGWALPVILVAAGMAGLGLETS
ncbi:chromate efflux transporter [Brevundimonas sp. AAP58]|uniref:chromate efflux transporter n=1 Tax=Brevundimonas sp. AAP58 TaxID=1523422 RepID=UPI000B1D59F4|nr:chromate efflux transporter [Brevundimonas sp. AAP58]